MNNRAELLAFEETIRKARSEVRLSQEALASRAGLHRTYISLLERGLRNPSLTVIVGLATGLGTTAPDLITAFDTELRAETCDVALGRRTRPVTSAGAARPRKESVWLLSDRSSLCGHGAPAG
jgi:transcriptional regulator with XRE-family HTH domain